MITPPPKPFSVDVLSVSDDKTTAVVRMICEMATFQFQVKLGEMFGFLRVKSIGAGMKCTLEATPAFVNSIPFENEIEEAINKALLPDD